MVRAVVGRVLEEQGFKAIEAEDGHQGLQVACGLKGALSLVITDLNMPHLDGYEFAQAFRRLYPGVPILFMTGKSPSSLPGNFSSGDDPLIFKPFDPDSLLDAVARLLESRVNVKPNSG